VTVSIGLLIVPILSAMISGSTTRALMRHYSLEEIIQSQSWLRRAMGVLVLPAVIAAFVWGFANLTWWQVVLALLAASIIFIVMIQRISLERWMLMEPIIQAVGVLATVYLWFGMT